MSVLQMSKVFKHSQSTGVVRVVLLALADVASDEGEISAYPRSQAILAGKANCSVRHVRNAINELASLGELEVLQQGDGRRSSDYRITLIEGGREFPPDPSGVPPWEEDSSALGGKEFRPISTSLSIPDHPSTSRDDFDEFWDVYPRKEGKGAAREKWKKAVKQADPSLIIAAAVRYRDLPGREPTFTAHPSTWLNQERWEDEPVSREVATRVDGNRQRLSEGIRTMREPGYMNWKDRMRALGPQNPSQPSLGAPAALSLDVEASR